MDHRYGRPQDRPFIHNPNHSQPPPSQPAPGPSYGPSQPSYQIPASDPFQRRVADPFMPQPQTQRRNSYGRIPSAPGPQERTGLGAPWSGGSQGKSISQSLNIADDQKEAWKQFLDDLCTTRPSRKRALVIHHSDLHHQPQQHFHFRALPRPLSRVRPPFVCFTLLVALELPYHLCCFSLLGQAGDTETGAGHEAFSLARLETWSWCTSKEHGPARHCDACLPSLSHTHARGAPEWRPFLLLRDDRCFFKVRDVGSLELTTIYRREQQFIDIWTSAASCTVASFGSAR